MRADAQPNKYLTDHILDEAICPVARMRLLTDGMNDYTLVHHRFR